MSSDDRTRAAFDDLRSRTESVDPQFSLQRLTGPSTRPRRFVPALAGVAVVAAVVGIVGVSGFLSGPDTEPVVTDPSSTTLGTSPTTDPATDSTQIPTTTITVPDAADDVLPTHRVTGVAADDVLFVRRDAGASAAPYAELPPDYAGIRLLDNVAIVDDGGEWWQVELLDPIRLIDLGEPLHGAPITGWVNSAFLEEYDPRYPDVAPCTAPIGGGEGVGSGSSVADHVYAIRQFGLGGCIRTVVTFGQDFDEQRPLYDRIGTDVRPADPPAVTIEEVNGTTVVVLDDVPYAWVTEAGESGAKVGRWTDNSSLAIYTMIPGFTSVQVHDGRLIIDTTPSGEDSPSVNGVHLIGEPAVGMGGTVEMWGLARPFEANLSTLLFNETGEGPPFVMTNDWLEAWGVFRYRASGLGSGDSWVRFTREGGENGVIGAEFTFTIPERGDDETVTSADLDLTDAFRAFATGEITAAEVPFGACVSIPACDGETTISLGFDHFGSLTGADPGRAEAWVIDQSDWNGYSGPFDVLNPLRGEAGITVTTVGDQPHCASPALDVPSELEGLRHLSIRPAGITSCLEWYSVELFVADDGRIAHVMLDLWEP